MNILSSLILSFIKTIRPLLGDAGVCRYAFTCTQYAEYQLKHENLSFALYNISKRILSCNPFW